MPQPTEQDKHLHLLRGLFFTVVGVVIVLGGVLYMGYELPPSGMKYQWRDSTGYAPPPAAGVATASVPRSGIEPALPDLPDGSVPPQAEALVSPARSEAGLGKVVYANNCAMCHGDAGRGDGPVSDSYQPRAPDLTTARVRAQSDGALFYKITNGILSTPIPEAKRFLPRAWHGWKNEIPERERWQVVAFLRTLENPNAPAR